MNQVHQGIDHFKSLTKLISQFLDSYLDLYWIYKITAFSEIENTLKGEWAGVNQFGPRGPTQSSSDGGREWAAQAERPTREAAREGKAHARRKHQPSPAFPLTP